MINLLENGRRGMRQTRSTVRRSRSPKTARPFTWSETGWEVRHAGIARSLKFIIKNFDTTIRIGGLEKVAGLSRRGFLKAFLKHTGHKPGAVLRQLRIEYAKHLLVQHDLSLTDLARQSGFKSANTFCVAFQRMTGSSPKKFQRQAWLTTYMNQNAAENPVQAGRGFGSRRRPLKQSKNGGTPIRPRVAAAPRITAVETISF